jgi:hypothetical protein
MTKDRQNLIQGIIRAVTMMKLVRGEMTAETVVRFGSEDQVTLEEASEVLAMKEAA